MYKRKLSFFWRYLLVITLIFILSTDGAYAVPVLRLDSDASVSLEVDNRYGSGSDTATTSLYIYNDGNETLVVNSVSATSTPTGVTISIVSEPSTVAAGGREQVTIRVNAGSTAKEGVQNGVITIGTDGGTGTVDINMDITVLIPAKLESIEDKSTTIIFNKPKSSTSDFVENFQFKIRNIGDTVMTVKTVTASKPSGGITLSITNKPSTVASRNSETIILKITAPSSTSEGTYTSKISLNAGTAGSDTFTVKIKIEHGIIMSVSVSKIDFGDVELYEQKTQSMMISEDLGYKSITGVNIKCPDNAWLSSTAVTTVPAGQSKTTSIDLLFDGNAQPQHDYKWNCIISSDNAGSQTIPITARMDIGVAKRLEELLKLKSKSNAESSLLIDNMYSALNTANEGTKKRTCTVDELITLLSISDALIDLIKSYNDASRLINQGAHESAFDSLVRGSVAVKMISTYSEEVTNKNVMENINYVNSQSYKMMEGLVQTETTFYENKLNSADISTLDKMNSYVRLSEIWGLVGDPIKEKEYRSKADAQRKQYNDMVDSAKAERIEAEKLINNMQSGILSNWGGTYVLLNPFNYDTFSENYNIILENCDDAEVKYRSAGESALATNAQKRHDEIVKIFRKTFVVFYGLALFYIILFGAVLTKCVKGLNSYKRDYEDVQLGDYLVI